MSTTDKWIFASMGGTVFLMLYIPIIFKNVYRNIFKSSNPHLVDTLAIIGTYILSILLLRFILG